MMASTLLVNVDAAVGDSGSAFDSTLGRIASRIFDVEDLSVVVGAVATFRLDREEADALVEVKLDGGLTGLASNRSTVEDVVGGFKTFSTTLLLDVLGADVEVVIITSVELTANSVVKLTLEDVDEIIGVVEKKPSPTTPESVVSALWMSTFEDEDEIMLLCSSTRFSSA